MKYYSEILTILRLLAVGLVAFSLYRLTIIFTPFSGIPPKMVEMFQYQQHQVVVGSLKDVGAGIVLYLIAPLLARIITRDTIDR